MLAHFFSVNLNVFTFSCLPPLMLTWVQRATSLVWNVTQTFKIGNFGELADDSFSGMMKSFLYGNKKVSMA